MDVAAEDGAPGVLVTRPEPEATALAARLAVEGYRPILSPALEIRRQERLAPAELKDKRALILTSAAAAAALAEDVPGAIDPPAFAVGEKTAAAARDAGLTRVEAGPGDAAGLLERLSARGPDPAGRAYLVLRGRETALDLAAALCAQGIAAEARRVYAAEPAAALSEAAAASLREGAAAAALLLSARTTEIFLRLVAEAGLSAALGAVRAVCVSPRAAAPAAAFGGFAEVVSAEAPTLADTLARLRVTIPPQLRRM